MTLHGNQYPFEQDHGNGTSVLVLKIYYSNYVKFLVFGPKPSEHFHPPCYFPNRMALRPLPNGFFIGHFVVRPPCKKVRDHFNFGRPWHFVEKILGPMDENHES